MTVKRVFVSSVETDLLDYRNALREAISKLPWVKVIGMEDFGASDRTSLEHCIEEVKASDIFIGVLGPRYGSIPQGRDISFCEIEYDAAAQASVPRYMFQPSPSCSFTSTTHDDDDGRGRLGKFRQRVSYDRQCGFYDSPQDLAQGALRALNQYQVQLNEATTRTRDSAQEELSDTAAEQEATKTMRHPPVSDADYASILMFPFVTNVAGFDSGITVSNVTAPPFGNPVLGRCVIHYFGTVSGESPSPASQTSAYLRPGETLTFTMSGGGSHGVGATPGFQGYIVVGCHFPDAQGSAFVSDLGAQRFATAYLAERKK